MIVAESNLYGDGSVECFYDHGNYIFSMGEYQVVDNLGISSTEIINKAIKELNISLQLYRCLLEYHDISNEEIEEWFAKFDIQI